MSFAEGRLVIDLNSGRSVIDGAAVGGGRLERRAQPGEVVSQAVFRFPIAIP